MLQPLEEQIENKTAPVKPTQPRLKDAPTKTFDNREFKENLTKPPIESNDTSKTLASQNSMKNLKQ